MNILDEDSGLNQRRQLEAWKVHFRQISVEIGRSGMKDHKGIIPLLHRLKRPTLISARRDCSASYSRGALAGMRWTPGAHRVPRSTAPLYRLSLTALLIMAAAGPALGIASGVLETYQEWARYRWDAVYAVELCTRAADRLFAMSGGHSLYDSHPLQRAFCDLHAMSAHAFLNPDTAGELFGRVALGLEPNGII